VKITDRNVNFFPIGGIGLAMEKSGRDGQSSRGPSRVYQTQRDRRGKGAPDKGPKGFVIETNLL